MIYITTNHGTGDTYMTLAFAKAVERVRGDSVTVMIPPHHDAIARMFPDVIVRHGMMPDSVGPQDSVIVAHPSAVPKRVRIDHLCLLARPLTHADLWRSMLGLDAGEPFRRGIYDHKAARMPGRVLLIPDANSIPNSAPEFWMILEHKLREQGRDVRVNRKGWSLDQLFAECDSAEWVIGPQCGVMMILCHALFPCRKTFATPSLDTHGYFKGTFPYMRTVTFAGEVYADADEVKIEDDINSAISAVLSGPCAVLPEVGRGPVSGVTVPVSWGDFFDRLSVLDVKYERLPVEKRALVQREFLWYSELASRHLRSSEVSALYRRLREINANAWDANDVAVKTVLNGSAADVVSIAQHYADSVRLNRDRIAVKDEINRLLGSMFGEVKSYYG